MEAGPSVYRCVQSGCGKTFTRKDHLVRHSANHTQASFYCVKCHRPFKRLDLLQRHEKRNICGSEEPYVPSKRRRTASSSSSTPEGDEEKPSASPVSVIPTILPPESGTIDPSTLHMAVGLPSMLLSPAVTAKATLTTDPFDTTALDGLLTAASATQGFAPALTPGFSDPSVAPTFDWSAAFGMWPPDAWETVLPESCAPASFFEQNLGVDMPWTNALTPRMQESAERGGDSGVGQGLLSRLQSAYPEFDVTASFLDDALQHYWSDTAPTFPFIHRGTFTLDDAPECLLAMLAIVGSVHMPSNQPRRDFRKLVSKIRGLLVQDCGLDMPITTLQAFSLCHIHDTWFGSEETQFVAQCVWPIMVAHSRKKGIGVTGRPDNEGQEEETWAAWAKDEERRRSAYCVLLIDTQISAFWNQHPSRQLSIFAHIINLPCPRPQWEARTACDWFRVREVPKPVINVLKKPRSGYLPGLHPEFQVAVVSEGYSAGIHAALGVQTRLPFRIDIDNKLAVEMIVIGLMAVAWDCRTRGGMGIKFKEGTKHWRPIVLNAVINLRAAWELAVNHLPGSTETRDLRDTFAISIISVLSDIPMLQVAAGATTICGAAIGPRQYADARRRLRLWVKTDDAWTCLWQSARYLRQALFSNWGLYSPLAVYLTTLTCWAYAWALSKDDHISPPSDRPQHTCTMMLDTILQSPIKLEVLDRGTADLLMCASEKMARGEEVERDNAALLWRLTGGGTMGRRRTSTY